MIRRLAVRLSAAGVLVACSGSDPGSQPAGVSVPALPASASPAEAAIALGATPIFVDESGRPRLLRATAVPAAPARTTGESARQHVARLAPAWGVRAVPTLAEVGAIATPAGTIVRLRQLVDGLPVDRADLRVLVGDRGELHVASGTLYGAEAVRTANRFATDAAGAIARAIRHAYQRPFDPARLAWRGERLAGGDGDVVVELARAQRAWHVMDRALVAAWVVEAYASDAGSTAGDAFRTVIAASDGRILEHRSLVSDAAFKYRVYASATGTHQPAAGPTADFTPHPSGSPDGTYPPYVASTLVLVDGLNRDGVSPDPWLPANAQETVGNNVDAYADFHAPSGLSYGDFRATATAPGTFDRAYDTAAAPMATPAQQMAAVTSLFYNINWLHDFWYDAGFTEAAGNAQDHNYGRGGEDRDAMLAEAQDNALAGSRNNANMATPADGLPPRMQVYLWSGRIEKALTLSPSARRPLVGHANFGPENFDVTASVALADDGAGASPTDGCEPFSAPARIALVDRGNCNFTVKVGNAQAGGALGVIVANNVAGATPQSPLGGTDPTLTLPTLSVTLDEGAAIKADLVAGPVTARLQRSTDVELDGSLDATLIAHEFGHYMHHRLSDCGTKWCGALSEGWGDFLALLMAVRAGDDLDGAYPFSVYTTQSFSGDPGYFGIRRAPYSYDVAKNALSFRHMADGEPLPAHPMVPSAAPNSEVHNAGEVWAAALWDGYVALQRAGAAEGATFDEVHRKMARYVVAGLALSPPDVNPLEARDAILAAVLPASQADHDTLAAAFARRGFGSCASAPGNSSTDFQGIVESAVVQGRVLPGAITLDDSVANCDGDGVLDNGETARVRFPLSNPGHADLADVTITLTSATPGLTVATPPIALALPAYATTTIEAEVALDGNAPGPLAGELRIAITAPGACDETRTIALPTRMNVDDVPSRSATESFDATSRWEIEGETWRQVRETALDGYMHGPAPGAITDARLESPTLQIGAEPFRVTFQHRHDFEFTADTYWDGGVVEISRDGGITWVDVATLGVTPGYAGALSDRSHNPLASRLAYGGKNPSHPAMDTVTLDFGTQLANETVRLRFRLGADQAQGTLGWEIDDVAFSGLADMPFPAQEVDDGACGNASDAGVGPDAGDDPPSHGGCCGTTPPHTSHAGLLAAVLARVLRRRRRR